MAIATQLERCPEHLLKRRTVANATAIPKGTVMKLTDPNTAIASAANSDPFAGIAVEEKTASDGVTEITCAMGGKWSMTSTAAAITAGGIVSIGGANTVEAAVESDFPLGTNVGKCLNTLGGGGGTAVVQVGEF
jgi:hypothetical protein